MVSWLPLLVCLMIVRHYSNDPGMLDAGTIASTYLGITLLGAVFMALGCFASSLTRNQIIAAMLSLAAGISLFLISFISLAVASGGGWRAELFRYLGLVEHMEDFAAGIVDTRPIVLYVSLTGLFLFLTLKVVESRRWK
jgi:ABC-2 type transport system permease protein